MTKNYIFMTLLIAFTTNAQTGVGVGTTSPQQKLHLTNSVGTVRIEGLNKNNSPYNGGLINDPATTYPLYVDCNGVLTLKLDPYTNSDGSDAIDNSLFPATNLILLAADADGKEETTFYTYAINVTRNIMLEIKYNISFDVYANNTLAKVNDGAARRISTYYTVDAGTRRYGPASKCYFNNAATGVEGTIFNSSTTYIPLAAGAHTIKFKAEVSTAVPAVATYVKLAVDTDAVFMRFY
ncbi:hypothetical protein [Flavobacterium sp. GT3R68]|uniref:hypothetical protein n=1 Tax=Flavobacterium sp. GT3R68 TaxID=2594437 RepID=UPI000FC27B60|nr:hypothetical protein [Flavobacterium sp. GT3R68]RTY95967.1 hypothetical protein EKL32_04805 [Flavobacterium sp. GSN2]TRW93740.1 hypothetical protein FNW07_02195 [Flavobacterium sp. GT3R68]